MKRSVGDVGCSHSSTWQHREQPPTESRRRHGKKKKKKRLKTISKVKGRFVKKKSKKKSIWFKMNINTKKKNQNSFPKVNYQE